MWVLGVGVMGAEVAVASVMGEGWQVLRGGARDATRWVIGRWGRTGPRTERVGSAKVMSGR